MFYAKNHPMLLPKSTDLPYGSLTIEEMKALSPELTEAEKKSPQAKYFYQLPAPLPQEHKAALAGGPMDVADAFEIWDYGQWMNTTGHCRVENGYCVLPNGVTYAAVKVEQVGRTDEMVAYYNAHFAPEESLFYKTWFPGMHYLHFSDGAVEDFGFGRLAIKFTGLVEVEDLRLIYDDIEKNDPACISINGSHAVFYNLDSDDPSRELHGILTFYHRLTDYGREMRMRFWCGIRVDHQGGYIIEPAPAEEAMNIARCTMEHLMQEYTNDAYLEKKFWEDEHPEGQTLLADEHLEG